MRKRKNTKIIPYILRQVGRKIRLVAQKLIRTVVRTLLRTLKGRQRRPGWSRAGFVLPTVTMVMLVVVLLTIAISLRSFDRAQDARNVRVNQAVLSAAAPALDRARAKLEELLVTNPPTTDTPTDDALYAELTTVVEIENPDGSTYNDDKYTFDDEERLRVSYDLDGNSTIDEYGENDDETTIEDNEITKTAWRFPVDTDNNGKYDSYSVYGIFLRSPERESDGSFKRARSPLDARTPPMPPGTASQSQECKAMAGTSSSLVGDSGWYKSDGKLKKSFFVYAVTVPITDENARDPYEPFKGTRGFSALEYQQDWQRIPLTNNAVVYEDDLEIAPGPEFRLNGRIQANSNFIISSTEGNPIELYLISSKNSCFYEDEENSKIIVGGNVINGLMQDNTFAETIDVHLQQGSAVEEDDAEINKTHQSVSSYTTTAPRITNEAQASAYNSDAYASRISWLVEEQIANYPTTGNGIVAEDPSEVRTKVDESTNKELARRNALETYFKKLVRKVPFAEVPQGVTDPTVTSFDADGNPTDILTEGTGDNLRPKITEWVWPTGNINAGDSGGAGNTELTLDVEELEATNPAIVEANDGNQYFVGDRVLAGNNLPQKVWNNTAFTSSFQQQVDGTTTWLDENGDDSGVLRYREPRVAAIADVGSTDRDGFWEDAAATAPEAALDGEGGLRVITGAGVYERDNSFLPPPPTNPDGFTVVWPDTMPMSPTRYSTVYDNKNGAWTKFSDLTDAEWTTLNLFADASPAESGIDPKTKQFAKGDLRMRATAVYYYAEDFINDTDDTEQKPIACISSYYDPSTSATAEASDANTNGIVYGRPTTDRPGAGTYDSSTQRFTDTSGLLGMLAEQANMVFPDGRFVNEKLRDALQKADADRSLSEQAAIDTSMCALGILGNSEVTLGTAPSYIPDRAIKEIAFLDSRQIKASDSDNPSTTDIDESFTIFDFNGSEEPNINSDYDLSLEERQPMEIRATQIDLDVLRQAGFEPTTSVGPRRDDNEYLLPFSGIIYASRDDALPDRSDPKSTSNEDLANSAYDYKLDPSRRPNGIMLINGETVARPAPSTMTSEEVTKEKGLTLVSNLPVYIQGDFNKHKNSSTDRIEEFNNELDDDWGDFYRRDNINGNFACRAGDPRLSACTEGDNWRPVNILADSLTLLSDEWRPGFRNEGDFDLRNNAGNGAVMATVGETELTAQDVRRNNGFFANDYAVNGLSSGLDFDGAGTVYTTSYADTNYRTNSSPLNSSYFNNFVTPVQRRVNFPEYVMESCLKLPVSACEPDDWVVGERSGSSITNTTRTVYDLFVSSFTNGTLPANTNFATVNLDSSISSDTLVSGTTATMPPLEFQRFPRRVAFLRNQYGELEMSDKFTPIPIGVDSSGIVKAYPYQNSDLPRSVDNALWFRTTGNSSSPFLSPSYAASSPLFYLGYNFDNQDSGGGKPRLPSTPTVGVDSVDYNLTVEDNIATTANEDELYSPSNYVMCIANARTSKDYYLAYNIGGTKKYNQDSGSCSVETSTAIQTFRTNMQGLTADATWTAGNVIEDVDGDNLVVYDLPATLGGTSSSTTITLKGSSSTVFVLRGPANADLTFNAGGVVLELQNLDGTVNRGVDPNNVFWISDKGVVFKNTTNKHLLVGNFIGKYDSGSTNYLVEIGTNTKILGGRFLGFKGFRPTGSGSGLSQSNVPAGVDIRAITAGAGSGYVNLVPVLQIHEPDNSTAGSVNGGENNNSRNNTAWLPRPTTSPTFNLVAAVGDTPSRPGQSNGGLQNFVRFQENWQLPSQNAVNISGAFIQLGRSKYATASQQHVPDAEDLPNPPPSDLFGYEQSYEVGANNGVLGFQTPPVRAWGFDVGLLSQSPDLFAQKFTLPSSDNKPDEFFREVSRDDDWVKGLLCADPVDTSEPSHTPSGTDCSGYE